MAFASRPILTVAVSLVLAACGGGGGSNAKVPTSTSPVTRQGTPIPPSPSQAIQVPSGRSGSGSIVQTGKLDSTGNITDKITLDKINVRLDGDLGISNQNEWDVKFTEVIEDSDFWNNLSVNQITEEPRLETNDPLLPPHNFTHYFRPYGSQIIGGSYGEIYGFIREKDYLTLGNWSRYDLSVCDIANDICPPDLSVYEDYGSFVFGNDLFTDVPTRGRAIYEGLALLNVTREGGVVVSGSFNNLLGDTFLSVDFEKGTVYGKIDNIRKEGFSFMEGNLIEGSPISSTLNLNNAEIKSSNNGFFNGNVTGTFNGISYEGTYGGQFYGNNESDGLPGTVAGTFNAKSDNDSYVLFGAWMGDK